MPVQVLLWLLGIIGLGGALLALGLRGKQVNDHPACRCCGFDLSGVLPAGVTCPECGAGLKRPNATRRGQRRKRPIFIAVGTTAFLFPGLLIGATTFAMLTGKSLDGYKPLSVLLWEVRRGDAATSRAVAAELLNRMVKRTLPSEQLSTVVETALWVQGDPDRPWCAEWGRVIERARLDDAVNKEQLKRFQRQTAVLDWKVRPRLKNGYPLPVVVNLKEARVEPSTQLTAKVTLASAEIDGQTVGQYNVSVSPSIDPSSGLERIELGYLYLFGAANSWGRPPEGIARLLLAMPAHAVPGSHVAVIHLRLTTIRDMRARVSVPTTGRIPDDDPDTVEIVQTLVFEVLPTGAAEIELVDPAPEMKEKAEEIAARQRITVSNYGAQLSASYSATTSEWPIPACFNVSVRAGGRVWPLGVFTSGTSAGTGNDSYSMWTGQDTMSISSWIPDFTAHKVDVILRPNASAALLTTDLTRIYGAELVFKDVDVQWVDYGRRAKSGGFFQFLFGK
jgi:hypothetical protein